MCKRLILFLLLGGATTALHAQGVQLCDLAQGDGALMAHGVDTPLTILAKVIHESDSSWTVDDFELIQTKDSRVRHTAAAQHCTEPFCNCIFYDPDFLPNAPSSSGENWLAYYVLAHEAGHLIKANVGSTRIKKEAAADDWAGWALEKIHAPIGAVMAGVDYVADSEEATSNYHSRRGRRNDALKGYNRAAEKDGKPQYQLCNDDSFPASSLGLYLVADAPQGMKLRAEKVASCGTQKIGDVPTDFNRDLRGACLLDDKKTGAQLTWNTVGLCSR